MSDKFTFYDKKCCAYKGLSILQLNLWVDIKKCEVIRPVNIGQGHKMILLCFEHNLTLLRQVHNQIIYKIYEGDDNDDLVFDIFTVFTLK